MDEKRVGAIFISEKDYPRLAGLGWVDIPETYEAFRAGLAVKLEEYALAGRFVERFLIDPADLSLWAYQRFEKVDSDARAAYAAHLMALRDSETS